MSRFGVMLFKVCILFCIVILTACSPTKVEDNAPPLSNQQQEYLKHFEVALKSTSEGDFITYNMVQQFYALRSSQPCWTTSLYPNKSAEELVLMLENAMAYGLDTTHYVPTLLRTLMLELNDTTSSKKRFDLATQFDLEATNACFLFMSHLKQGTYSKNDTAFYLWRPEALEINLPQALSDAIDADNFKAQLLAVQPNITQYHLIQQGLEKYLQEATLSDVKYSIPNPKEDSVKCYRKAKQVLVEYGFVPDSLASVDTIFTAALKNFQRLNGLSADGKIGKNTRKALQLSNYERYQQAVVNLQRLRWEEDSLSGDYLYVSIPTYQLKIIENDSVKRIHKVMVGAPWTKTPTFSSEVSYFITYPFWHVPYSIATKEILPALQKDSNYLSKKNYTVLDRNRKPVDAASVNWSEVGTGNFKYKFRQGRGRSNSLGIVKIIFPNEHNVYLHDTPSKYLFKREVRAYSHGCMRLQDPLDLAAYLLERQNTEFTADSLDTLIVHRRNKRFDLEHKLPIHIRYITCDVDSSANIVFFQDIYKQDAELKSAMFMREEQEESTTD